MSPTELEYVNLKLFNWIINPLYEFLLMDGRPFLDSAALLD